MKAAFGLLHSVLLAMAVMSSAAYAQVGDSYPSRPVTLVVPFPAGGPTDIIARVIARKLQEALAQSVVVDNRAGATGNIGAAYVGRAKADGLTLLLGTQNTHGGNPALYKSTGYDAVADFQPITLLADQVNSFVAVPSAPFNSIGEMVEVARRQPGEIKFASIGNGSGTHLEMELLQRVTGTKMLHVPYKGTAPALLGLFGGDTVVMYVGLPSVANYVKEGRLKLLAIDGQRRQPEFPNVPTTAEAGFPNMEMQPWYGVFAPANTPRPIVDRLFKIIVDSLKDPSVRSTFEDAGFRIRGSTSPEEFSGFVKSELALWADRVKRSGAQID